MVNKAKQLAKERRKKDREWIKAVGEKYNRTCVICGSTKMPNAHRIIPKEFKETRWDVENGIILCPKHHKFGKFSAHKNSLWFINLLQDYAGFKHEYLFKKLKEIENDNNKSSNCS